MSSAADAIQNPAESLPHTATAVEKFIEVKKGNERLKRKVVTNKLGQKREIWVKTKTTNQ